MNLPFVLDIAIGLIFIYLVLSLLASEIQELLATLLQWRAKHLKESIENLLKGGKGTIEEEKVKKLVQNLYNKPLLENVNQEARGFIEKAFRSITWFLSDVYRVVTNKTNKEGGVFGDKRSGPSYISSETFATTLVETLKFSVLIEKLIESKLKKFSDKIITDIENIATLSNTTLENDKAFESLKTEFLDIINYFKQNEATLLTSIERMSQSLNKYIDFYSDNSSFKKFIEQVQSFKLNLFGENNERAIISGGLKPSLTEIMDSLRIGSKVYNEIKATFSAEDSETYKKVEEVLKDLPQSVHDSLTILARRAKTRVQKTENELHQLTEEISVWFDRSMARASGVYKRNAKGVAILIGLVIAFAINADTFHIFNELSSNETLRQVVTERASQIALSSPNSEIIDQSELERIKIETNSALKDISLPIGWNSANLSQQLGCSFINKVQSIGDSSTKDSQEWSLFFKHCLSEQQNSASLFIPKKIFEIMLTYPFAALKMIAGWFLSGIAIAMGAPFWFDLLGKVVNVRNSGSQPPSAANQANPK